MEQYLAEITEIMRQADKAFETSGGGTKHYLRDCFLPLLEQSGFTITKPSPDFEQALQAELDKLPYTKGLDDGQYNDGQVDGFESGARWAHNLGDARLYKNGMDALQTALAPTDQLPNGRCDALEIMLTTHHPAPAVRWVKASERLPRYLGDPGIHYRIDGFHKVLGNFYEKESGELVFGVIGTTHADYDIPKEKWHGLEWLDESGESEGKQRIKWINADGLNPHPAGKLFYRYKINNQKWEGIGYFSHGSFYPIHDISEIEPDRFRYLQVLDESESPSQGQGEEWISVEGGLPVEGREVLCYCTSTAIKTGIVYGGAWLLDADGYTVTHWRPLPAPPTIPKQ